MPEELRPSQQASRRKRINKAGSSAKPNLVKKKVVEVKGVKIEEKLEMLEKKEKEEKDDDDKSDKESDQDVTNLFSIEFLSEQIIFHRTMT